MKSIYLLAAVAVMLSSMALGCTSPHTESGLGEVVIKGSDTMVQMVSNLAEGYMEKYPDRKVAVTSGGSGTGIAALINGEVDIADASRLMKDSEIEQARAKGVEPVRFIIARDALSVIVNPNNPVDALTIGQISDIYTGNITNWKEVGGPDMKITLYGRQSTSGTYAYFLEEVVNQRLLGKRLNREYSPKMLNMEGNTAIVDAVARDVSGIGYVGVGYLRDDVKPVRVAKTSSDEYVSPSLESISTGDYPVSRTLNQYTAGLPKKGDKVYEFIKYELSPEGQRIVEQSGFLPPLDVDMAKNDAVFALIEQQ